MKVYKSKLKAAILAVLVATAAACGGYAIIKSDAPTEKKIEVAGDVIEKVIDAGVAVDGAVDL